MKREAVKGEEKSREEKNKHGQYPAQTLSSLRPVSRLGTVHVLWGRGAGVICWEAPVVNNDWQI